MYSIISIISIVTIIDIISIMVDSSMTSSSFIISYINSGVIMSYADTARRAVVIVL